MTKFQAAEQLSPSGKIDTQTCLFLARKISTKFPNDANAKEIHDNLLRLYLKMEIEK